MIMVDAIKRTKPIDSQTGWTPTAINQPHATKHYTFSRLNTAGGSPLQPYVITFPVKGNNMYMK